MMLTLGTGWALAAVLAAGSANVQPGKPVTGTRNADRLIVDDVNFDRVNDPDGSDEPDPAVVVGSDEGFSDNGGLELRLAGAAGGFEGPTFGGELSAAVFSPLGDGRPVQVGLELQGRHLIDTDPDGLDSASLTALTANVVFRGRAGDVRPYAGVGVGYEFYSFEFDGGFDGDIDGAVLQGFAGATIDLGDRAFLDARLTISGRDYDETFRTGSRTVRVFAEGAAATASLGVGIRL